MKSKAWTEKFMQGVFLIAACTSVLAVALICIFLFANGVPAIREIGFVKFITGELWRPNNNLFGIFPMIIGSLYVTAGAIVFGVPIGILTSVFMAMYCPKKIYRPLKAATELLAGIPSVVYGFFGLVVLVPMVREFGRTLKQMGIVEKAIPSQVIEGLEPEVKDHEPRMALDGEPDGLKFYRILAEEGKKYLKNGGSIYMEIGWDQAKDVTEIFEAMGFSGLRTVRDMAGNDRVVCARKEK